MHSIKVDNLDFGALLRRNFLGNDPNYLGTATQWAEPIRQIRSRFPKYYLYDSLFKGFSVYVWDLLITDDVKELKTLKDNNWSGFHDYGTREIHIAYRGDLKSTIDTINHEFGHYYSYQCGYEANQNTISREISRFVNNNFIINSGKHPRENFAEIFRALMGSNAVIGHLSDWKPYNNYEQRKFLEFSYYIFVSLSLNPSNIVVDHMRSFSDRVEYNVNGFTHFVRGDINKASLWWRPFGAVGGGDQLKEDLW